MYSVIVIITTTDNININTHIIIIIITTTTTTTTTTTGIDFMKIAESMNNASGAECKAVCTEAGMYALRERRIHVTQEDFEMAVAKVMKKDSDQNTSMKMLWK